MQLQTAKQEAIDVINHLPDTVNFDDILYRLFVVKNIHQGLQEAEQGQGISTEELLREIEQW
jgi:predicted transcriptional regulator